MFILGRYILGRPNIRALYIGRPNIRALYIRALQRRQEEREGAARGHPLLERRERARARLPARLARDPGRRAGQPRAVPPTPATHAILTQLKARVGIRHPI